MVGRPIAEESNVLELCVDVEQVGTGEFGKRSRCYEDLAVLSNGQGCPAGLVVQQKPDVVLVPYEPLADEIWLDQSLDFAVTDVDVSTCFDETRV